MRYLTSLPLKTASVWLSKSGGLSPLTLSTRICHFPTSASKWRISFFTLGWDGEKVFKHLQKRRHLFKEMYQSLKVLITFCQSQLVHGQAVHLSPRRVRRHWCSLQHQGNSKCCCLLAEDAQTGQAEVYTVEGFANIGPSSEGFERNGTLADGISKDLRNP